MDVRRTATASRAAEADSASGPKVRRWTEQRWLIDSIIRSNGMEWDQPRLQSLNVALGPEATADINGIRQRVQKLADIAPAFASVAQRREAKARSAEDAGELVTARENYYMAANYWASAQWPFNENCELNVSYNQRKRECFRSYARLADHHVEEVWIPFEGKALPAWLHLPPGPRNGRLPLVVSIPGMDGFKERSVALYGDPWLSRGIAVLVLEGPGQYESAVLGIHASMPAWIKTGTAVVEWLMARPDIDPERIAIAGRSFGTFFATIAMANEPRFCAGAILAPCLEPGCHSIFEEASPTFKMRFMYMAGYTDEDEFDLFRRTLTFEGHAEKIQAPFLCIAGEADELSPLEHAERLFRTLSGPRRLVVYQDCRHSIGGVPATNLGPFPASLMADWMAARFRGASFPSERWYVDASGRVTKTPL